jgi:hypothetical protein
MRATRSSARWGSFSIWAIEEKSSFLNRDLCRVAGEERVSTNSVRHGAECGFISNVGPSPHRRHEYQKKGVVRGASRNGPISLRTVVGIWISVVSNIRSPCRVTRTHRPWGSPAFLKSSKGETPQLERVRNGYLLVGAKSARCHWSCSSRFQIAQRWTVLPHALPSPSPAA